MVASDDGLNSPHRFWTVQSRRSGIPADTRYETLPGRRRFASCLRYANRGNSLSDFGTQFASWLQHLVPLRPARPDKVDGP
jgi:hypothetical protein